MTKELDAFLGDLLSTHPHNPANARYVVPLDKPEDEQMAHAMVQFPKRTPRTISPTTLRRR